MQPVLSVSLKRVAHITLLLCLYAGFSMPGVFAQQYVNGNLSTGATAKNGTAAPSGYTWSELQGDAGNTTESNTNLGFGASIANGRSIADDFTVPAGQIWNLTKFTCYAYSTNYTGTTSPYTDLRVRIHSSSPLAGATTIVFGDLETNRLSNTSDALIYRIGNSVVPTPTATNTNRRIWKLEATISVSLSAGTYWVEWQSNPGTLTSNFTPSSTIVDARTQSGYNAIQKTGATGAAGGTWAALVDAGNPASAPDVAVDMPFAIDYSSSASTFGCATGIAPANNSTNVAPNGGLSWSAVTGATSYDVYLGTSPTPPLVGNVTGTNYPFSPNLNQGTTYYYQIVPKNAAGSASGCPVFSFTTLTAPPCATGLAPANNATNVAPSSGLSWSAVTGATSYDVYLGTSPTPPLIGNVTGTNYPFSPNLNPGITYYYKIIPKNAAGSATDCPVFTFTTLAAPLCATGLVPANNASNVTPNAGLSWSATAGATSYDVYLGTSPTPPLVGNVTGTTYPFSPNLNTGTTYYYKIVPKNAAGSAVGCSVLIFTTLPNGAYGNVGINVAAPQRNFHIRDVIRLEPRDVPPSNPVEGDLYYDVIVHKLRVFDGTTWQNCW